MSATHPCLAGMIPLGRKVKIRPDHFVLAQFVEVDCPPGRDMEKAAMEGRARLKSGEGWRMVPANKYQGGCLIGLTPETAVHGITVPWGIYRKSKKGKIMKSPKCIGDDPMCPCQDGDPCHYRDHGETKGMEIGHRETRSAFGVQWKSVMGKRAFGWTMIAGANGPMILGVTYDPDTEEWDGESCIDLDALERVPPVTGRIPHPAKLRDAIARSMRYRFDHEVRPSGTF